MKIPCKFSHRMIYKFANGEEKKRVSNSMCTLRGEWETAAVLRTAFARCFWHSKRFHSVHVFTAHTQHRQSARAPKIEHANQTASTEVRKRKKTPKIYCVRLVIPAIILSPNIYGLTQSLSKLGKCGGTRSERGYGSCDALHAPSQLRGTVNTQNN